MVSIRTISVSLLLSGAALAQEPRPAVRMLPAQPMEAEAATVRAQEIGYDPLKAPRGPRPMFGDLKADENKEPGRWTKFTKWMEDKGKAVKKAFDTPPDQPPPRVGQSKLFGNSQPEPTPPRSGGPLKLFSNPQPPQPPQTPRISTAEPAYRWYGWGTTTPGLNQFAPGGDYPIGSAQWYRESGATPGAFPVPTMNPYRPTPGPQQPAYVPPPTLPTAPTVPPPSIPKTSNASPITRRTIAETPAFIPKPAAPTTPVATTQPVPAMPPELRKTAAPVRAEPSWKPAPTDAPRTGEPAWRPAEAAPVIRGQSPQIEDSPLVKTIQKAGQGLIFNLTVTETGPNQLVIAFEATTKTLADIAAQSISKLDELKPFAVEFAVNIR